MPRWDTWNKELDQQLMDLAAKGLSSTQVGERMGMTRSSILGRAGRIGLSFDTRVVWDEEKDAQLRTLYIQGLTHAEIGEQMGLSRMTIKNRVRVIGLNKGETARTPQKPPRPRVHHLTPDERVKLKQDVVMTSTLTMEDLTVGQCRYPVNDNLPFTFCGAPQKHGVYCDNHWKLAHQ